MMIEINGRKTEELAYLLWEQQGRPENRSAENWLEAEFLAQSLSAPLQPMRGENEIDLRMRGLGPLTQSDPPNLGRRENVTSVSSKSPQVGGARKAPITACIAGAVVAIALVVVLAVFRKVASSSARNFNFS